MCLEIESSRHSPCAVRSCRQRILCISGSFNRPRSPIDQPAPFESAGQSSTNSRRPIAGADGTVLAQIDELPVRSTLPRSYQVFQRFTGTSATSLRCARSILPLACVVLPITATDLVGRGCSDLRLWTFNRTLHHSTSLSVPVDPTRNFDRKPARCAPRFSLAAVFHVR